MSDTAMDQDDRRLLNLLQSDLTFISRPFDEIAKMMGLEESEVIERINKMKKNGIIRRIGAVLDSRGMGFSSTLVAMKVPPEDLEAAAMRINAYYEVTHNYLREHEWNLWFTLIAPDRERIAAILDEINPSQRWPMMSLPAERVYKIRAEFKI
ncbi:MAG: Lrp/AsnC family transcriptional regulator [Firmicutes bacterium]|nr:Lrp/AsnC family transcriptional regulator [Bacillota bacterium]